MAKNVTRPQTGAVVCLFNIEASLQANHYKVDVCKHARDRWKVNAEAATKPPGTPDNQIPNQICPHIHFRSDIIDREILSRKQHLNLLCTPKGYRWVIKKNKDESEADRMDPTKHIFECSDKRKKSGKTYVHNFLAEIWSLLTPEMVGRLKEMLMNEFGMTAEESVRFICEQRMRTLEISERRDLNAQEEEQEEGDVDEIQDPRLPRLIIGDQHICDRSEFAVGINPCHIKEFSRTVSNKLSEYVMAMMCAKRNNRHKRMAEVILNGLCNVTGEKCTLDRPKNRLHRILTLVSDRTALWLADNIEDEDKKRGNERKREDAEIRRRHIQKMKDIEHRRKEHEKLAREREKQDKRRAKQEEEDAKKAKEEEERKKAEREKRHQDFEKNKQKKNDGGKDGEDKKPSGKGDGDKKGGTGSKGGSKSGASKSGGGKGGDSKGGAKGQGGGKGQGGNGSGGGGKGGARKTAGGGKGQPAKKPGSAASGGNQGPKTQPSDDAPEEEQAPRTDDKLEGEPTENQEPPVTTPSETAPTDEGKPDEGAEEIPAEQRTEEGPKPEGEPTENQGTPATTPSETAPTDEGKPDEGAEETPAEQQTEKGPKPEEEEVEAPAEAKPEEAQPEKKQPEELQSQEEQLEDAKSEEKPAETQPDLTEETPAEEGKQQVEKEPSAVDPAEPTTPTQKAVESSISQIVDTKPVATPRQEAIQDIISKELEMRMSPQDEETKELIREVSAKTATWIDQKVTVVEDEYGTKEKKVPPVTQKPKGPIFSLRKSEDHINVCRASHQEAEKVIRETRGKAPTVNLDESPMTPDDAKMWANWAENATQMAEDWGKWIDKTIQDAEEKTVRYKSSGREKGKQIDVDKQDWDKFSGKTLEEALEWRRNRKALEEMAAKWQEKSKKQ